MRTIGLEAKASQVAETLRAVANERRLLLLCHLVETGEGSATSLAEAVGLSTSALSQHLSKMRMKGSSPFAAMGKHFGTASPMRGSRHC